MWFLGSTTATAGNFLRAAGPNEIRCVARESLGFYRTLVVGGIYEFVNTVDINSISTYNHALRSCIGTHARLSAIIAKNDTDSPYFEFCPRIDLSQHVQFLERDGQYEESEAGSIQRILPGILDEFILSSIPSWKIVVLPFSDSRCFIAFAYSHALGDGLSGCAFHRTFLDALQEQRQESNLICKPIRKALSPPFDTPENLPISWSYLLSPFLGQYLPKWLSSLCGFSSEMNAITPSTWTGTAIFYDADTLRTGVELMTIDQDTVQDALKLCRMNDAKLTGLLHQLILDALSECLPKPHKFDRFGAGTAINMRCTVGVSNDEMGVFASGDFQMHLLQRNTWGEDGSFSWTLARAITDRLAIRAKETQDQPLGLLRYLFSMRAWTLSKIGGRRDDSYAISNLMSFQPLGKTDICAIKEIVFCRPTDVAGGAALSINVVSVCDGPMNITVNWQAGGLDLGNGEEEVMFVSAVCRHIEARLARLCKTLHVSKKS
ncbi:alcohol acetyltransferase [Cadophora sp. MPI-SDFR-AT-0126]|nr:alcohol acetyltransferase [Leotiomycetes sp. MPI-SDFR-AT-0126]